MADDYYDLLGVSKNASREEIKKAYKKLAKKLHPDNKDTGDADKFKKINEAAAVLGDDKKRAHYDQFGTADANFGGGQGGGFNPNDFSQFGGDFGDIFDHLGDIFGGSFGFGGRGRRRQARGDDLRYDIEVTLEEAAFGVTKNITFAKNGTCSHCDGSGAESPGDIDTCSTCNGAGRVRRQQRTPFGIVQTAASCPDCGGRGKEIKNPCHECDGTGIIRDTQKIEVKIPAGIDEGMQLRLEGKGDAIPNGMPGDLYVFVHVKPHDIFIRKEDDIYLEHPLTVSQAALGCEIDVPTLIGTSTLKIPSGTQPDTTFKMKDKGISDVHGRGKGDQLVKVKVKIPTKLSKKEKELFKDLDKEAKKSGFWKTLFG